MSWAPLDWRRSLVVMWNSKFYVAVEGVTSAWRAVQAFSSRRLSTGVPGGRGALVPWALAAAVPWPSSESWGHAVNGALCLCWDGNNLPFQCSPTSGFPATQSCMAEYFAAFLIYTYQILAGIETWLISHYDFLTKGLIHEEEERELLRRLLL